MCILPFQEVGSISKLKYTLGHELLHNLGYPGPHNWPCSGDQPVDTADVWCSDEYWPALLLGWTDTDHDGVVEILDTTPYGMTP